MFDVIWTDPDKELVGEHRARKELEKNKKAKQKARNSVSARSSTSTATDRSFAFFSSIGWRRNDSSTSTIKSKTASSSTPSNEGLFSSIAYEDPTNAKTAGKSESKAPDSGHLLPTTSGPTKALRVSWMSTQEPKVEQLKFPARRPISLTIDTSDHDQPLVFCDSLSPTSRDSVASQATSRSNGNSFSSASHANTTPAESVSETKPNIVQKLGPWSFVSLSTEVTVSPRTPQDAEFSVTTVKISANPAKPKSIDASAKEERSIAKATLPSEDTPPEVVENKTTTCSPKRARSPSPEQATSNSSMKSPAKRGTSPLLVRTGVHNVDAWKPPADWACIPTMDSTVSELPELSESSSTESVDSVISSDLELLHCQVKGMLCATSDTFLRQIKKTPVFRANRLEEYKEAEMERKRWMLAALQSITSNAVIEGRLNPSAKRRSKSNARILALYETSASASFLASLHHTKKIYHLAQQPLSHHRFPNIHPIVSPTVAASGIPIAPHFFGSVYSLSLPSQIPSSDIPRILRSIHQCLLPGGVFYLSLIDPLPHPSRLGPKLRTWMEDRLVLNLERKFRCTNPSRLFPLWLQDVSLRGPGSTITATRFPAIAPSTDHKDSSTPGRVDYRERGGGQQEVDCVEDELDKVKDEENELCSLVGRMLWQEVWGVYVTSDKWWWQDAEIVEECVELGTFWETHFVEAVKI